MKWAHFPMLAPTPVKAVEAAKYAGFISVDIHLNSRGRCF